jgi:ketosteroid isomerase-like protein
VDVVRIAPLETGGVPVERRGLEAIMDNAVRLTAEYEIHRVDIDGPFVGPDQFAVRFAFDETHKPSGERNTATKMSLYTVADGKIVREEVYYYGQPQAVVAGEPR